MRVGALNIVREALKLAIKDGSIKTATICKPVEYPYDDNGLDERVMGAEHRRGLMKQKGLKAVFPDIVIEKPKKAEFGDYSTNIAMLLAPLEKRSPREVALVIASKVATL